MGRKPDLYKKKKDLAIWLSKKDRHIKLNVQSDGKYAGTVIDFNDQLAMAQSWYVYIIQCEYTGLKDKRDEIYYIENKD